MIKVRRIQLSDGWVDLETRVVHRPTVSVLTPMELRLLTFLAEKGNVCSWQLLRREVWEYNERCRTRTFTATAHRLRAKIEADPGNPSHIHTVRGTGLRFVATAEDETKTRADRLAALEAENRHLKQMLQTLMAA